MNLKFSKLFFLNEVAIKTGYFTKNIPVLVPNEEYQTWSQPNVEGVDCRKKEKFPTSLLGKLTLTKAPIA